MPRGAYSTSVRSTHQLESRMREIRLSGSGEGAVLSRPYLISNTPASPNSLLLVLRGQARRQAAPRLRESRH